ncbi:glycosyltransferase family 2 protein [Hyphobacterium sp. CCMP332]|nr:glycosyltransferase family 2 protein [Hyphobacterium sp. CCMP332]
MTGSNVAVVILNWNGLHFLQKFIPGIVRNSAEAQIVLADNASTDDSIPWLEQNFPQVQIIRFKTNHGFCKGYNEAFKQIDSDFYVLLNSDVEVGKNWLLPLIETFNLDKSIAIVQPKIKWQKNKVIFEYAGAAGGFIDKYGYPFCRGRILNNLEKDKGQYDNSGDIFWASGACLMIRSEVYHKMGGLDENFFAHMEEIDLCWRVLNNNYKIKYVAESEVYHIGGGTLPKSNPRKTYLNHRNSLFLLYKNLPDSIRGKKILIRLLLDGLSAIIYLLQFRFGDVRALLRAHRDYYKMKSGLQRSEQKKNPNELKGFYDKSILFDYFLKGRRKFSDLDSF